jgi:hypothetical protein
MAPLRATDTQKKDIVTLGKASLSNSIFWDALISGVMPY